jgi:hypothetical protein
MLVFFLVFNFEKAQRIYILTVIDGQLSNRLSEVREMNPLETSVRIFQIAGDAMFYGLLIVFVAVVISLAAGIAFRLEHQ